MTGDDDRSPVRVLDVDGVGKTFGARRVLTAASLRADAGTLTVLLGRNGAGKSTLLRIAAGLTIADHGNVSFRGRRVERPRLTTLARDGLFFLADRDLLMPRLRVGVQLDLIARRFATTPDAESLATLRVDELRDRLPDSLSGGERRRASVAAAVCRAPVCLLADEPLRDIAPADGERVGAVFRRLAAGGCAVVLTGHEVPPLLALADRVVWCTDGTTHELGTAAAAREHWAFRRGYLATAD